MKRKSKIKKIGLSFILVYVCYILVSQQITIGNKKVEFESYKTELNNVANEYDKLMDETEVSKTSRYVEKLARERMGFIKQGENAVIQKKD